MKTTLTDISKIALENLFYAKILALEQDGAKGSISKINQLDTMLSEIITFIHLHPRARFHISCFGEEDIPTKLIVVNTTEDLVRNEYDIKINPSWTGFDIFQHGLEGDNVVKIRVLEE